MEAVEYEKSGTAGALFRGNAFEKPPQISSLPYDVRQVWLTSANPLGEKGSDRHEFLWLGNRTTRGKVEGFSAANYRCPQILRVPSYDSMSPLSHVIAATEGCGGARRCGTAPVDVQVFQSPIRKSSN